MTTAGGKLARSVTLREPKGFKLVTFAAGDTPPAWAADLIKTPSAWESAPAPTPEGEDEDTEELTPEDTEDEADASTEEDLIGATEEPAPAPEAQTPEAPEGDAAPKPSLPPKRGSGSGKDAWAAYATAWGVSFPASASRDDIIDAVEAAPDVPSDQ